MAFPKRLLAEDEDMVLDLRPHWIALVVPVVAAALILVAETLLFVLFDPPAALDWIAIALGILLFIAIPVRSFLTWATSHFVVTSDRVIHRSGWLAKRSMEIPLERINDVRFEQSILERVVGAGDIRIESGGEYGQNHFTDIRNPEHVQKLIYEVTEANQVRMGHAGERIPIETVGATSSPLDEIERLASMKERGLISEEEFEVHKRRLLGRL